MSMLGQMLIGVIAVALFATGGWFIGERYDYTSVRATVALYSWITVVGLAAIWLATR